MAADVDPNRPLREGEKYFQTPILYQRGDLIERDLYLLYSGAYIIFRPAGTYWDDGDTSRLTDFGVQHLYYRCESVTEFNQAIESRMKSVIESPHVPVEQKARLVYATSLQVAEDLFDAPESASKAQLTVDFVKHCLTYLNQGKEAFFELFKLSSQNMTEHNHGIHCSAYAVGLARNLGYDDQADLTALAIGAMLHDLGKSQISREILDKPAALTSEEMAVVRKHPIYGYELTSKFSNFIPELSRKIILQHHERSNGQGYPHQLTADRIHPFSRIVRIIDIFDSMTAHRTYKSQGSALQSLQEMITVAEDEIEKRFIIAFVQMMGR